MQFERCAYQSIIVNLFSLVQFSFILFYKQTDKPLRCKSNKTKKDNIDVDYQSINQSINQSIYIAP